MLNVHVDLQTPHNKSCYPQGPETYCLGSMEQDRLMIDDNEEGLGHICWPSTAFISMTFNTFFLKLCPLLCLLKTFSV